MKRAFGLRRAGGRRRYVGLTTLVAVAAMVVVPLALAGAINTTTDPNQTVNMKTTGVCLNGPPASVNCNIYSQKEDVFLSGSPVAAALGTGTYYFAVLEPGGQPSPNPGAPDLLSLDDASVNPDREFSITDNDGTISYSGAHVIDGNKLSVYPYAPTTNPGGVYILAVCKLSDQTGAYTDLVSVQSSKCKYDAFKVKASNPPTTPPAAGAYVTKDAAGTETTTYTWGIKKMQDAASEVDNSNGSLTVAYTVHLTYSAGTPQYTVSGTISVFNPNVDNTNTVVPMNINALTDTLSDGTTCTVTGAPDNSNPTVSLTAFETDFSYSCSLTSAPQGQLDNTVEVDWPAQDLNLSGDTSNLSHLDVGSATMTFPSIAFSPNQLIHNCTTVTDQTPSDGTSNDNPFPQDVCVGDPGDGGAGTADGDGFTWTYHVTYTDTAGTCTSHTNTATFTVDDDTTITGSDHADVKHCVGKDLGVSKDASTSFTRTYRWTIQKSVVGSSVVRTSNTSVTFNYSVVVNSATPAYTDSGWTVSGTITVSNPNDWEDIVATITDSIGTGWSCSVTNGASQTVPMSGSIQRSYSCSWTGTGSPAATGTNTATATWDAAGANTPDGSATGTAGFAFSAPTTSINKTITITDPAYSGGTPPGTLGTVTYGVTALPKTFTYSHTISVNPNQCTTYPNTATITETGQNSSASVKACPTVNGLTMGYWHNKNGQAQIGGAGTTVITDSSGSHTVCKLTPYLRAFAPFADLTQYASCSQVAAYDLSLFNVATCSGTTCNSMLKAQMLATALNVYFGVTNGNELIDLKHGCSMVDKSDGTGSCAGSEDWSPAFSGQSSMTVNQMLIWAASQSNSGGSSWYSSKSLQVLAKDAFDAINNSVAPAF